MRLAYFLFGACALVVGIWGIDLYLEYRWLHQKVGRIHKAGY